MKKSLENKQIPQFRHKKYPKLMDAMDSFEKGYSIKKICKDYKICLATFYNYRNEYSLMEDVEVIDTDINKADINNELEQYKNLVAELTLENRLLKAKML